MEGFIVCHNGLISAPTAVYECCARCLHLLCSVQHWELKGERRARGFLRAMDMRKLLQTTPPTQAVGYLVCGLGNRTLPQHGTFQVRRLCLLEGQVCSHYHLDNGKLC